MESRLAPAIDAGVPSAGMAPGGVAATATTIMKLTIHIFSIGLRFMQMHFSLDFNEASEMVFTNFVLLDKSVTCFKLFIAAYRQVHAEGVGMFFVSCLIGLSMDLCGTVIHLYTNHRSRARAWISGLAIFVAAGAALLGVKIPDDYAWHSTAVEALLVLFVCLDAVLLLLGKINQQGGNENLARNLLMVAADTLVNVCLFADYLGKINSPCDAQKILHLIGSCLPVLIGLGQLGWITYKACTHGAFAWGEVQAAGAAMDGDRGVDVEAQMVVEEPQTTVLSFGRTPPVSLSLKEREMALEDEREEAPLEEVFEVLVDSPP